MVYVVTDGHYKSVTFHNPAIWNISWASKTPRQCLLEHRVLCQSPGLRSISSCRVWISTATGISNDGSERLHQASLPHHQPRLSPPLPSTQVSKVSTIPLFKRILSFLWRMLDFTCPFTTVFARNNPAALNGFSCLQTRSSNDKVPGFAILIIVISRCLISQLREMRTSSMFI